MLQAMAERFRTGPAYDSTLPAWPVCYSDEEKQRQQEAGDKVCCSSQSSLHLYCLLLRQEVHIYLGTSVSDTAPEACISPGLGG